MFLCAFLMYMHDRQDTDIKCLSPLSDKSDFDSNAFIILYPNWAKAFHTADGWYTCLFYTNVFHLVSRHTFCSALERNVQATIRLDLLAVPIGMVLT